MGMKDSLSGPRENRTPLSGAEEKQDSSMGGLFLEGFLDSKEEEEGYESPLKTLESLKRQKDVRVGKSSSSSQGDLFSEARGALSMAESLNPVFHPQKRRRSVRSPYEERKGEESSPNAFRGSSEDFTGRFAQRLTESSVEKSTSSSLLAPLPTPSFCKLPPLELLEETHQIREPFLQFAQDLTNNLFGLGAGAVVKRIVPSLRQTRYTLRPQPEVKLSKIVSLKEELELRLQVSDLRFEPAKEGDVYLFVKNERVLPIPLRNLLSHSGFTRVQGGIPVALGRGEDHSPVILDLAALPHLLIGGKAGTGKTVLLESLIASILFSRTPQEVRLVLCSDGESLKEFASLPHLLLPLCQDPGRTSQALSFLLGEMERRNQLFTSLGVGSFSRYQKVREEQGAEPLPRIVLCMDELSYALKVQGEESRKAIYELAKDGERAGIHLVLISKEPLFWLLPGKILRLFPARACFQTETELLSQMVVGDGRGKNLMPDGELLLGVGEKPLIKLQGAYVSKEELERLKEFFKE